MALTSIFSRPDRKIGDIQLDGVVSEQHSNTIRLTQNPVEFGVSLTDHAIIEPKKLVINGIVTNSPFLGRYGSFGAGEGPIGAAYEYAKGVFGDASTDEDAPSGTRIQRAYQTLLLLQNSRVPLTVQTGLINYENMLITSITTPSDNQERLNLSIELVEVRIANTDLESTSVDDESRAGNEVDSGSKVSASPSTLDYQSILAAGVSVVGLLS